MSQLLRGIILAYQKSREHVRAKVLPIVTPAPPRVTVGRTVTESVRLPSDGRGSVRQIVATASSTSTLVCYE